jgi:hypothetical protein
MAFMLTKHVHNIVRKCTSYRHRDSNQLHQTQRMENIAKILYVKITKRVLSLQFLVVHFMHESDLFVVKTRFIVCRPMATCATMIIIL